MKKLLMMIALILMTMGVSAQTLEGSYLAEESFTKKITSFIPDDRVKAEFQLWFLNNDINLIITANVEVEDMGLEVQVTIPGTFTRTGGKMTCTYDKDNIDIALMKIHSSDPEMSAMLESDEADIMYGMIEEMLRQQITPYLSKTGLLSEQFQEFTILTQDETGIVVQMSDASTVVFTKM